MASATQAAPPPPPPPASSPPPYALIAGGALAAGAVLYAILKPSPAPPAAPAAVQELEAEREEYVPYNAPVAYTKQVRQVSWS